MHLKKVDIEPDCCYCYPSPRNKISLKGRKPGDVLAAEREDALTNQFLLDATFLGYYSENTLKHINFLYELENKTFAPKEEDMELLKKAAAQ